MQTIETTKGAAILEAASPGRLRESIVRYLRFTLGLAPEDAGQKELFTAVGLAVRELLIDGMAETEKHHVENGNKRVYYLSMEFLIGKSLENNLINMEIYENCREAVGQLGFDLNRLLEVEPDAGLGNGGLGRLAACFIDSMATLGIAGYGYGINYEYGLFRQSIRNGEQRESPDNWLTNGSPWQIERTDQSVVVPVYGHIEDVRGADGVFNPMWVGWNVLVGVPCDMPVVGYGAESVNYLRLFSARGSQDFDMQEFNEGDYIKAVQQRIEAETVSKVLYPSDAIASGRELRLIQEYFLVACSVRDIVRRFESQHDDIRQLPEHVAVQLNDTHPALTVAELMRFLVDEREMTWEGAWQLTEDTLAYTNHTLLPEALETWPEALLWKVIPRHMQIIHEINHRFLDRVRHEYPGDDARLQRMSIIDDAGERLVRMCNLAIVGSHSVNGVSALHSELVKTQLVPDFAEFQAEKFNSKTNGITPRRWLLQSNPQLSRLISETIGKDWITNLDRLRQLEVHASDPSLQCEFLRTKNSNKLDLARIIRNETGVSVDPASMFDVQVKRIHEYKRQLLSVLRIVWDYFAIVEDGWTPPCPRTYLFAGKAAPGYWTAKQIIRLINDVAGIINSDSRVDDWIRICFLPNYRVGLAERIFPASDLSEQVSTAGFEASGTGNMKFTLNGALTMGTRDGANIEIGEEVGEENIFFFGLTTEQVANWHQGGASPRDYYDRSERVRRVVDALCGSWIGSGGDYGWLRDKIAGDHDGYFHLADLDSYCEAQQAAGELYADSQAWARKALYNVARAGKFSSDRTIHQYASEIWNALPNSNR